MTTGGEVQWVAPLVVLFAGVAIGALLFLRGRGTSRAESAVASGRGDLQLEFDAMIHRLRELAAAGAAFDGERRALERDAAALLRELSTEPVSPVVQVNAAPNGNRALRAMLWATGSCVVLAVMYVVLLQSAAPRPENGIATGGLPPTGDTTLAALEQQLAAAPDNAELRLELAGQLLQRGDMQGVLRHTTAVLQHSPEHPRALSYDALARLATGDSDTALRNLERALAKDPALVEAWVHLSLVHTQRGDREKAIAALDQARSRAPESAAMFDTLQQEIEAKFGAGSATPPAGDTSYTIRISGRAPEAGVIFVSLRPAGVTSGPPVAVKRLERVAFPLEVTLSAADSMQGGALPASARIEARVDADGDPLTRDAGAATAVRDRVAAGSTIDLTLQ